MCVGFSSGGGKNGPWFLGSGEQLHLHLCQSKNSKLKQLTLGVQVGNLESNVVLPTLTNISITATIYSKEATHIYKQLRKARDMRTDLLRAHQLVGQCPVVSLDIASGSV